MKALLPLKRWVGHILGINKLKQTAYEQSERLQHLENSLAQALSAQSSSNDCTSERAHERAHERALLNHDTQQVRRLIAENYLSGKGLEIGALTSPLPVANGVTVEYLEKYTIADMQAQFDVAGLSLTDFGIDERVVVQPDILDDAETLLKVGDNTQDFVIINHVLEHLENPVKAFKNILRITKHNGIIYLALPDMRRCFDRIRTPTPIEHILRDYEQGPAWSRDQAYHEFAKVFVAEGMDKGLLEWCQGDARAAREQQIADDLKKLNFNIHFHTWTPDTMLELFTTIKAKYRLPFEFKLMLQNHDEVIFYLRENHPLRCKRAITAEYFLEQACSIIRSTSIDQATGLDESGNVVNARGDQPNRHDILTGSDPSGLYSTAGGDTTCGG